MKYDKLIIKCILLSLFYYALYEYTIYRSSLNDNIGEGLGFVMFLIGVLMTLCILSKDLKSLINK